MSTKATMQHAIDRVFSAVMVEAALVLRENLQNNKTLSITDLLRGVRDKINAEVGSVPIPCNTEQG
jgi:hypothetical protein